tara:strand:+ start:632 stop:1117 length:486 start_codon:yes stop_codon:yes gene_type:complete
MIQNIAMVYSYGDNFRNLTMNKNYFLIKILIIYLFTFLSVFAAQSSYFNKGKKLFDNNEFDKSKIFFERDIVFNPKSESSYLYLAKIYNKNNNDSEEEINLNNVLILNPQNDEAIYMLTLLRIKQSDYNGAKGLIEKFDLVCKSFCSKKKEIQKKFEKLKP